MVIIVVVDVAGVIVVVVVVVVVGEEEKVKSRDGFVLLVGCWGRVDTEIVEKAGPRKGRRRG